MKFKEMSWGELEKDFREKLDRFTSRELVNSLEKYKKGEKNLRVELKVREDVDLKELEKHYGFKYVDNSGQYKFTERNIDGATYIYINTWNRKIVYRQDRENDNMCLEKLYDLIKDGLIVKEKYKCKKCK